MIMYTCPVHCSQPSNLPSLPMHAQTCTASKPHFCVGKSSIVAVPPNAHVGKSQWDDCFVQGAWDAYAMGNYPFPSNYMGGTAEHPIPAWPSRAACSHLSIPSPSDSELLAVSCCAQLAMRYPPKSLSRSFVGG